MSWRLPLADVRLSEDAITASMDALRSNWLTMGPRTQDLERAFAERHGVGHAVAVSSGTAAIHLGMLAAGVGDGDEVIVPAVGFVAAAHAPHWCGGRTVFADIGSTARPDVDLASIADRMTDRTKAVVAVHMFGYAQELGDLRTLCEQRGVAFVEDCCEAVGAVFEDGSPVGTGSPTGCFSFFAKTQLPVGEGGILLTDDEDAAARVRLLRSHAMSSVTWDRHRGHAETYDVTDLGFNYRLDEPRAAMAHAQLGELDATLEKLRATVSLYHERLEPIERAHPLFSNEEVRRAGHFAFPVLLPDQSTRDFVREHLAGRGIQTTFYPPITDLSLYAEQGRECPCPRAEEFGSRHLAMPLSTSMTTNDVDLACEELTAALSAV